MNRKQSETRVLKPLPETEKKMQPLSEAAFDNLLKQAYPRKMGKHVGDENGLSPEVNMFHVIDAAAEESTGKAFELVD
jgi:hypothetical protein